MMFLTMHTRGSSRRRVPTVKTKPCFSKKARLLWKYCPPDSSISLSCLPFSLLYFFCFFLTCIAHPPPPHQPLSLSAAGIREGEGKPGGADGALLQGAAGKSRLRQHQERRHAGPDVSQPSIVVCFCLEGCISPLRCSIFIFTGRDKGDARLCVF